MAPGTAAVAAVVASASWVPVSRVSSGPWLIVAGSPLAPEGGVPAGGLPVAAVEAVLDVPEVAVVDDVVAAEAMPAAPSMVPVANAPVTSNRRYLAGFR